jgi:hypothetical protein
MKAHNILVPGWQESPNERGTIDILWSCVSTLFVCLWVMLHLNVPARDEAYWKIRLRKLKWLMLALLAPELVMLFATGQWASAKRSTADMAQLGAENWSMVHAFYADGGGFMLRTPDSPEFPVTANQIHYLVSHKYLPAPGISEKEIWDKSKADVFAKGLAAFQVSWFVAQFIAREVQGLPTTLLELATLAMITCSGATFFFWFSKPLDVEIPTILDINFSMAQILIEAGAAANVPWRDTPLDFAEPLRYTSSELPLNQLWGLRERPLPRLPNDRDTLLHDLRTTIIVAIPTAAFGTFHLLGWKFTFATRLEQLLWRWVCVGGGIVLGLGCAIEAASIIWHNYTTTGLTNLNGYKLRWPTNLMFFIPGFLYVSARMVVIVEVGLSFRALPQGCFATVQWTKLLPHV